MQDSLKKNENMVFVQGGNYKPIFCDSEINITDLYVSKFQVTQDKWKEVTKDNPSHLKGEKLPVESITWIKALEFCNKLSEIYGFQPVYKIQAANEENDKKLIKIIYKDKIEVNPDKADFSKVEGYRLPTEAEWEWFARGGKIAIQNRTFNTKYAGSNNIGEVAWYKNNSETKTHEIGIKKPNELGLYDCTGNVWEWCYDTFSNRDIFLEKYIYNNKYNERRMRGGSYLTAEEYCNLKNRTLGSNYGKDCGFRIVRTAHVDEVK